MVTNLRHSTRLLKKTSVGKTSYPSSLLGVELYITTDFINAVRISHNHMLDEFLKPVNWVHSSVHNNYLVIISQYEANVLVPIVLNSNNSSLHIYGSAGFGLTSFVSIHLKVSWLPQIAAASKMVQNLSVLANASHSLYSAISIFSVLQVLFALLLIIDKAWIKGVQFGHKT